MKYDTLRILPLLFLLLLASACHRSGTAVNRELRLADSIMEENPDTAMYVLQRIANPEVMSEEEYAMYCLLATQAADLTNTPHASDALITIAVKYFSTHNDNQLKAKAYYYMGRVKQDMGQKAEAEENYLLAINAQEKTKEYRQTGLFYNTLSEFYMANGKYTESLDTKQKAYNNYLLAAKEEKSLHPGLIALPVVIISILLILLIRYQVGLKKERTVLAGQEKKIESAKQVIQTQRAELTLLKKELRGMKKSLYNSAPIVGKVKSFNDITVASKEKPALNENEWNRYLEILDETYGFVTSLKQTYHKLTDIDIRICALLREGVSTAHICTLMGMTPETLSRRILRIRSDKMNQDKSGQSLEIYLRGSALNAV